MMKFLGMLLLVLTVFLPFNTENAYAYTLEDLGSYVENPEWFDNQSGRLGDNVGLSKAIDKELQTNVGSIYFDSTHKSFQIQARRYNPTKGIDKTSKDMKWSVVDERICTVDNNGFVKAGSMTGATIVILEDETVCMAITVVNRTGNYDSWYEDMFKDIHTLNSVYEKSGFKNAASAKLACEYLGNGYKVIVDSYLKHGIALKTDSSVRFNTIYDAVNTVVRVANLSSAKGGMWGDCVTIASLTSFICSPFTINSQTQKFGSDMIEVPGHLTNAILLDGIVYNVDNGNFREVAKESDWTWKKGVLHGSFLFGSSEAKAEINCEQGDSYSFTRDRVEIEAFLKKGVNKD